MGYTTLTNRETNKDDVIDDADLAAALASNKYITPQTVAAHRFGQDTQVDTGVQQRESTYTPLVDPAKAALASGEKIRRDANTGIVASGKALLGGAIGSASFGAFDPFQDAQEFNRTESLIGTGIGAVLPGMFGDEAGLAALARDPVSAEHAASALSSKFLYAGEIGGEANSAGKLAEKGLARASGTLEGASDARTALHVAPDLAGLDIKGLNAAHEAELGTIEAARVPQRQALADDLAAFRQDLSDQKLYLATKGGAADAEGAKLEGIGKLGKRTLRADGQLDRLLDNPYALAEKPEKALAALQQQQSALEGIIERGPELRAQYAADTSGTRAAALDATGPALERNKALQERIRGLIAEPTSERLTAIEGARATLMAPAAPKSLGESMLSGSIMGHVAGLFTGMPIIGPMLGAKVGQLASDLVFGRLGKATGEIAAKTKSAVASFLDVAKRSPAIPVLATRTLARVAYAPRDEKAEPVGSSLPALYKARSDEIKSQTAYDMNGQAVMRPEAREAMASRLAPIRESNPALADRMETLAARRLEFLSSKLVRKPDLPSILAGPDKWQPSDMEMRTFARYAAAVEDPGAVEHRVAAGTVTPEDAEAYHAVYPERAAAFRQQILTQLPSLRKTLPYQRKIALSIFTGVPVDPAMTPNVLAVLQGQFDEPGSEGGTQAPKAQPQFGSVKKSIEAPTPSQSREQG